MPRSFLSQALQVAGSAAYDDGIASPHTVGVAEGQSHLEGDLNVMRTLLKNLIGKANWYDAAEMSVQGIADKYFIQRVTPSGFDNAATGTGTSTTNFDTAIKTIADHNTGLGDAVTGGVILDATKPYRIAVRTSDDKNPIDDGSGNEVYGRLSYAAGTYTISWYSMVSGTETAYNFTSSETVDLAFVGVSRRFEDLDWNQFLDPSWHDVAGLSGVLDDANVITGPFSFFLTGLTSQQAVNAKVDALGNTANGEGASGVAIEDASNWFTGTNLESALNEIEALFGAATSTTYNFTEENVLTDNDTVYPALNKLDLKWGDLASVATGEGASLVGVEDVGGYFTGTNVEAVLQEIGVLIEDVSGWVKVSETTSSPISSGTNHTIPGGNTYTPAAGGLNMDIYLDGQLLLEGASNDYVEVSGTQCSFNFTIPTQKNLTYSIRK